MGDSLMKSIVYDSPESELNYAWLEDFDSLRCPSERTRCPAMRGSAEIEQALQIKSKVRKTECPE
jgi:hypothetical protein